MAAVPPAQLIIIRGVEKVKKLKPHNLQISFFLFKIFYPKEGGCGGSEGWGLSNQDLEKQI